MLIVYASLLVRILAGICQFHIDRKSKIGTLLLPADQSVPKSLLYLQTVDIPISLIMAVSLAEQNSPELEKSSKNDEISSFSSV